MGRTVNPLLRFRRFESFPPHHQICNFANLRISKLISSSLEHLNFLIMNVAQFANLLIIKLTSGSSSVGRAIAFQAIGREFEPRLPLKGYLPAIGLWICIQIN